MIIIIKILNKTKSSILISRLCKSVFSTNFNNKYKVITLNKTDKGRRYNLFISMKGRDVTRTKMIATIPIK